MVPNNSVAEALLKKQCRRRMIETVTKASKLHMKQTDSNRSGKHKLSPAVEQQINENLRLLYEQQLQADLPDKLKDLVAQLRSEGEPK